MHIRPRRVAIVVDHLYDYQVQLQRGFHAALNRSGISSVTFVGRHLHPADSVHRTANGVYDLLDRERYLGMLVSAANLGRSVSDETLQAFLRAHEMPTVCVSRTVEGFPAVTVDNTTGMRELMEHLVHGRGFREFVLIRGIPGNHEAEQRERVVMDFLAEHHLPLPPQRVLSGDFYSLKAAQELTRLLRHDRSFDVVVCVNDEMAFGAIQALERHGLNVPGDVAVVGFDDVSDARHARPALTSVRQPTVDVGIAAVGLLMDLVAGVRVPGKIVLPSRLVRRESCGAARDVGKLAREPHLDPALLRAFRDASRDPAAHDAFLAAWRSDVADDGRREATLRAAMLALHAHAATAASTRDSDTLREIAGTLLAALDVIERQAAGSAAHHALARNNQASSQLELSLSSHEHFETFEPDVRAYMQSLDIQRYALLRYATPDVRPGHTASVLSTSFPSTGPLQPFPTAQLLPEVLQDQLDTGHFVLVPLHFAELHFGLLLFEKPDYDSFDVEHVRYSVSCGLHQLHTAGQRLLYTQQLEQQVGERTRELEHEVAERRKAEQALRLLNEELSLSAMTDALTGIYNRAAFTVFYQQEWARHRAEGRSLGVLLCDVDHFKQYNDLYGHLAGDACLTEVARALDTGGRHRRDFTARFGGEEFVLVLPDTDAAGVAVVAARLLRRVAGLGLEHARSAVAPHVTISVGAAAAVPGPDLAPEALLEQADRALYEAKDQGRNRSVVVGAPAKPAVLEVGLPS